MLKLKTNLKDLLRPLKCEVKTPGKLADIRYQVKMLKSELKKELTELEAFEKELTEQCKIILAEHDQTLAAGSVGEIELVPDTIYTFESNPILHTWVAKDPNRCDIFQRRFNAKALEHYIGETRLKKIPGVGTMDQKRLQVRSAN